MDAILNSSDLNKSFIDFENISSNDLIFHLNSKIDENNLNCKANPFVKRDSKDSLETSEESTSDKESTKVSEAFKIMQINDFVFEKKKIRKDLYGNEIRKGGKHKVSFKDNIKGKFLVEITLIDVKQSSIRGKNYKKYTIGLLAKDKKELSTCNIF